MRKLAKASSKERKQKEKKSARRRSRKEDSAHKRTDSSESSFTSDRPERTSDLSLEDTQDSFFDDGLSSGSEEESSSREERPEHGKESHKSRRYIFYPPLLLASPEVTLRVPNMAILKTQQPQSGLSTNIGRVTSQGGHKTDSEEERASSEYTGQRTVGPVPPTSAFPHQSTCLCRCMESLRGTNQPPLSPPSHNFLFMTLNGYPP